MNGLIDMKNMKRNPAATGANTISKLWVPFMLLIVLMMSDISLQAQRRGYKEYSKYSELYSAGQVEASIVPLTKSAEQGLDIAQVRLAEMYLAGEGVQKDTMVAVGWLLVAEENGVPIGTMHLADCYFYGWGNYKDLDRARMYYEKSVENGFSGPMMRLGMIYEQGIGVPSDLAKAKEWYQKALDHDVNEAQIALDRLKSNGSAMTTPASSQPEKPAASSSNVVPVVAAQPIPAPAVATENPTETKSAIGYYQEAMALIDAGKMEASMAPMFKSAELGHADAQYEVAAFYDNGKYLPENKAEALKWLQMSAAQEHGKALYSLAVWHLKGVAVTMDTEHGIALMERSAHTGFQKAMAVLVDYYFDDTDYSSASNEMSAKWALRLAELGDVEAQSTMTQYYYRGIGVSVDFSKSMYWARKATDNGSALAPYFLGRMYLYGEGVAEDLSKAFRWFQVGADRGDAWSQTELAWMYDNGEGVAANSVEAAKWYQKAAEQGLAPAQDALGYMYAQGIGVTRDPKLARYWYQKAVDQGFPEAQSHLNAVED